MNRRLITHYRGVCKPIETGQKKMIELEPETEPEIEGLKTLQKLENEITDSKPGVFNHHVVQKFPLLITVEDFKKGLENKTSFFQDIRNLEESEKNIQMVLKIKKIIFD
jgi:hypothetical protein